jgi:hypothetical protein
MTATRILQGEPYTFRRRIAALFLLSAFVLGGCAWGYANAPHSRPIPAPSCEESSANRLGIAWSYEDGATERLDAFHAGIIQCERERGNLVCWDEENGEMPNGLERICGTPTQLNDTLARGLKVWWVGISALLHPEMTR